MMKIYAVTLLQRDRFLFELSLKWEIQFAQVYFLEEYVVLFEIYGGHG